MSIICKVVGRLRLIRLLGEIMENCIYDSFFCFSLFIWPWMNGWLVLCNTHNYTGSQLFLKIITIWINTQIKAIRTLCVIMLHIKQLPGPKQSSQKHHRFYVSVCFCKYSFCLLNFISVVLCFCFLSRKLQNQYRKFLLLSQTIKLFPS